jgi:hypothetical protein
MILARIKRGAIRTSVLVGLKLENYARTPFRSTTNLVKNVALHALVLRLVTAPIPVHAAGIPAGLALDEADPSPTTLLLKADTVKADIAFNPLVLPEQNASLVSSTVAYALQPMAIGKSYQTQQEEYQRELAAQEAARIAAEAERARLEKEAAAQKAAELAKQKTRKATVEVSILPASAVKELAYQMVVNRWGEAEWPAFERIVQRESGWNLNALNSRSGACGLFQANPCSKLKDKSPLGQVQWGIGYIAGRYQTPSGAWTFWSKHHWY